MENLTLEAVTKQITDAGEAIKTKASNAEDLAQKAYEKTEEFLKLKDTMLSKEDADKMQEQLDHLDAKMQKAEKFGAENKKESVYDSFVKAYNPIKEEIEQLKSSGKPHIKAPFTIELKDADVISLASTIANVASSGQVTISEFTGIVSPIRQRVLTYLQNVSTGNISTQYAVWVEEYDEEGTPIFIGEGDTKTQIDVQYKEQRAKVEKVAVHMKVTSEMLEDASYLFSFLQNNGVRRVQTVIENQLFNGNGTSPQLQGLLPKATAFNGGGLSNVAFATRWDVLNGVISQVKAANGNVNAIFVANSELHAMLSTKDEDGQYILPQGVLIDAQGQVSAWGVRLIGTNALTGTGSDFVGGDLSTVNVLLRNGLTVRIGESGDDMIENLQTVVIEQRLVQFISANDTPVLVKGAFPASIAIIEST